MSAIELALVAIRIDVDSDGQPDLFTIDVEGDRPLYGGGSIVFFTHPSLAATAMLLDDDSAVRTAAPPPETFQPSDFIDLPMMMYRLSTQSRDPDATIIEGLNYLLDMLKVLERDWIDQVKDILYPLADLLTFSNDYGEYLDSTAGRRKATVDAVLWSIGVVITHATVIRS